MIEIGVLYYSEKPEGAEITRAIQSFERRMGKRPNTIYFPIHAFPETFKPCVILAVKQAVIPENHFILAREEK